LKPIIIEGYADLHCHLMTDLANGGGLLWGKPDGRIDEALAHCEPKHGDGGTFFEITTNTVATGGLKLLLNFFEGQTLGHKVGGYPEFDGWPRYTTKIHQQMYIDWIKRAYTNAEQGWSLYPTNPAPCQPLADKLKEIEIEIQGIRDAIRDGVKGLAIALRNKETEKDAVNKELQDCILKNQPPHAETAILDRYKGGLRLMVSFAVNNEFVAKQLKGPEPYTDDQQIERQIDEMKKFVQRHSDFMEIAYNSAQAYDILRRNKLVVVLGVEVDAMGGWIQPNDPNCTPQNVQNYLKHLHDIGVRHIFPIHLVDNAFGGAAMYVPMLRELALFMTGRYPVERICGAGWSLYPTNQAPCQPLADKLKEIEIEIQGLREALAEAPTGAKEQISMALRNKETEKDAVNKELQDCIQNHPAPCQPLADKLKEIEIEIQGIRDAIRDGVKGLAMALRNKETEKDAVNKELQDCIQNQPTPTQVTNLDEIEYWGDKNIGSPGKANSLGLTGIGGVAIKEMMKLGMIIDIDHMSEIAADNTLSLAEDHQYPIAAGHAEFRDLALRAKNGETTDVGKVSNEFQRTAKQTVRIRELGGMIGVGLFHKDCKAAEGSPVVNNCPGSSKTWAQQYIYAINKMGGKNVAIGTDFNGFAMAPGPRFGSFAMVREMEGEKPQDWSIKRNNIRSMLDAQFNGVKYMDPILDPRSYRFSGEAYTWDERDVWEAIGIHKYARHFFGDDPEAAVKYSDSIQPGLLDLPAPRDPGRSMKIANFVRGFTATSENQIVPYTPLLLQTHYEQKAAYLAKSTYGTGKDASNELKEIKDLFNFIKGMWIRWTWMETGKNIPLERSKAGRRDFDINIDGVAHVGMLPDFIQDLKNVGLTEENLKALNRSAMDYVSMWSVAEKRAQEINR
jgi:microsomal dipeptidase-like Zn-dependent dipeptidase